jgi:hypothetical protein
MRVHGEMLNPSGSHDHDLIPFGYFNVSGSVFLGVPRPYSQLIPPVPLARATIFVPLTTSLMRRRSGVPSLYNIGLILFFLLASLPSAYASRVQYT